MIMTYLHNMSRIKNQIRKIRMPKKDLTTTGIDAETGILPISAIAETLEVHPRTLRIYDKEGILIPKRTDKNRRNYSFNDLERAKLVLFLTRNLAMNLNGVKIILAMLEQIKVKPSEYIQYINKIAKSANIDTQAQEVNIEKTSKRGRKAKNS